MAIGTASLEARPPQVSKKGAHALCCTTNAPPRASVRTVRKWPFHSTFRSPSHLYRSALREKCYRSYCFSYLQRCSTAGRTMENTFRAKRNIRNLWTRGSPNSAVQSSRGSPSGRHKTLESCSSGSPLEGTTSLSSQRSGGTQNVS